MYVLLYNISLLAFRAGIRIASLFNQKAKLWLAGREQFFGRFEAAIPKNEKIIWFHCASLGEFEQGRPILEKIKTIYPRHKILLTFFSPSGFEVRKNYGQADYIFYLPLDSRNHAKRFLDILNPCLVIFIKYEFWYYYIKTISARKIPLLLVSAVFRPKQVFFRWWGPLYRSMIRSFTHLFVQDFDSLGLLKENGMDQKASVAGDTRFDRVIEIANGFQPVPVVEKFCGDHPIIVAGSTWPDDEKILKEISLSAVAPSFKLIIAPHELGKDHLDQLKKLFPAALFYSDIIKEQAGPMQDSTVLIIDTIGLLSRLYHYATITYVGGGFTRDGIHNALEAAVYAKPVVFGPVYNKYREAIELIASTGARSFTSKEELEKILFAWLNDSEDYHRKSKAAGHYVLTNGGATARIMQFIQEKRLLTN